MKLICSNCLLAYVARSRARRLFRSYTHSNCATYGRLEDARRHLAKVDRLYLSTIETLAMAIDAKDDVTHSHVRRVQASALSLARALGITDESELKAMEAAEREKMKRHVDIGADILSLVEFPYPVVPIVRGHHENWDGSGYPRGLWGEAIPIGARILSVVDCFDALTSDRPYRLRMADGAALEVLRERRGTMYDPNVVDAFVRLHQTSGVDRFDAPEQHREVMQHINRSRQASEAPEAPGPLATASATPAVASADVLAFVSLARLASGEQTLGDVLGLASSFLLDIVPRATVAWYAPDDASDELVLVEAFGPAAAGLRGRRMDLGARLSGWVAVNRKTIASSPAEIDLDEYARASQPPLVSCMSVPVSVGESLLAVLTLYASAADAFNEATARLVQMVVPHIARAVEGPAASVDGLPIMREQTRKAGRDLRLVSSR